MSEMKENRWLQGYACAIASILKTAGADTQTIEAYHAGIGNKNEQELITSGVDSHDIEIFKSEGLL